MSKAFGKQSLSCGDIAALTSITEQDYSDIKQKRNSKPEEFFRSRFLRPKSPLLHSMDRSKSRSYSSTLDDIDCQLIQIKEKLSTFREQDLNFRERLDSLSNSIDELASRSSLTPSEASTNLDLIMPNDDINVNEEYNCKDDESIERGIENKIKNISSMSFSSEVLNGIPAIAVTSYKATDGSHQIQHYMKRSSLPLT